ncbi:hypothetical protein [Rhizobium sp. MHM7A]|uniref:hypothetical protein n=1 Tax=Rhizobium sp. MHM7A TaxID=2583233 RepID=UPI0011059EAE|nr:hypothetical protein [Rhizobium sp. MHM7A]TLX16022.1 hypothetical protein FFR93_01505 [Rhizobium sp. MHM7A]
MKFEPTAILPTERFVEVFVAKLVHRGWQSLSLQDLQTRKGLGSVARLFDLAIDDFEANEVSWAEIGPWVRVANNLRPSALGDIENWEHQLRSAQGYLTRFSATYPGTVELAISKSTADFELQKLTSAQSALVEATIQQFDNESRA